MLTFLILLGVLWIILRVATLFIEIPFRIIGWIFSAMGSTLFWVILVGMILTVLL